MSGIQFASEGENLGSRPRPKKRRSSILKSPSRNALHDLDPNAEERDTTIHAKKKRRSSRRVSFANTYQVQEFLTTNQLKILEDADIENETTQPTSPEGDVQPPVDSTCEQDARGTQAHSGTDISVGPGHCIRGLETLLSGPIKKQSHSHLEVAVGDLVIPHAILQPSEGAVQLPMIAETCEIPVENYTTGRSDTCHPDTDGTQDWQGLEDNCDNLTVGLLGPRYHCTLPVSESFSSSCHTSVSCSFAPSENHTDICDSNVNLDDTASFELTMCREMYLAADTVYEQPRDPIIKKQDASSFLKSFMETDQADDVFRQPAHSTFQTYADEDHFENQPSKLDSKDFLKSFMESGSPRPTFPVPRNCASNNLDSSPKKQDAKSFLQSHFGNETWQPTVPGAAEETYIFSQNETAAEMDLTACISVKETGGCKKKDASAFLKSLAETDSSDKFVHSGNSTFSSKVNANHDSITQKTHDLGRDHEVTSAMDYTTCVGGMLHAKDTSAIPTKQPDTTLRFGDDYAGNMEFTQCIGGVQEQPDREKTSRQKCGRGSRPLEDVTRIFDGAGMDLTVCSNPLSAISSNHPQSVTGNGEARFFHQDDTNAVLEMTTCLDNQASLMKSGKKYSGKASSNSIQQYVGQEKTRIFRCDDTTAAMEMTACLDNRTSLMKSGKKDSTHNAQRDGGLEKTRIFHYDEPTASMEMTTCLNGNTSFSKSRKNSRDRNSSNNYQPDEEVDKTRIFHHDETTAAMEMTTCLGNSNSKKFSKENNLDSRKNNETLATAEETRIFYHDDTTAAMEMTECLDKKSTISQTNTAQQRCTKVFTSVHAGKNEITHCIDGRFQDAEMIQENRRLTLDSESDKTQVFKEEDAAGMDFTNCIGGVLLESSSLQENQTKKASATVVKQMNTLHKSDEGGKSVPKFDRNLFCALQQKDSTINFTSDDTARMEMTTCIGGVLLNADAHHLSSKQAETTQIFTLDDKAQMELTTCVGSPKPLPSMVSPSGKRAQSTTCLDETSKMEMTACVGGIFPKMSFDSSQNELAKQVGDQTKIFNARDAESMDMTKCIGGLLLQSFPARTQSDNINDNTKVFTSDDTARMEMTTCIGGLLSKTSSEKTTAVPDSTETISSDCSLGMKTKSPPRETGFVTSSTSQQHCHPDQTRHIFTSDGTESMEITTCIGGINRKAQSSDDHSLGAFTDKVDLSRMSGSGRFPSEQTCIFTHDNTGKMELTTCIGGISGRDLSRPTQDKSASPSSDTTCLFSHDETSKMELTKCIGMIDLKATDLSSSQTVPSQAVGSLPSKSTNLFTHDEAGRMVSTSCVGGLNDAQLDKTREMLGKGGHGGETSLVRNMQIASETKLSLESTDCPGTQVVQSSGQPQGVQPGLISVYPSDDTEAMEVNRYDNKHHESPDLMPLNDSNKMTNKEAHSTKHDSDTFTIEPSSVSGATEPTSRRSGTYTLDKPPVASTMIETLTVATDQQKHESDCLTANQDSPSEECAAVIGDLNSWGSLDSSVDGIDNEQPVWVENTEDFAQLSAEAGVSRVIMMEAIKDHNDSENVNELPTFGRDDAQDVITASQMQDSDVTGRLSEVPFSDETDVKSSSKPLSGPVSMHDFLEFLNIDTSTGHFSTLPCMPQVASPKTLSDSMEDHFILKPKKELYEWAVNHLSSSIEKMQEAVSEQEQHMSEDNPEIVTEVQCASPEKAAKLHKHIESLHKACTEMSRGSFQEWRLKMLGKTNQSFKQTEEEMNNILATLSSSLDTLNKNLEDLGKFKEGIDETLTRLKSVEPPREEQVKEYIDNRNQLANRQVEIEEMKKNKAALESESLNLKSDIKQFKKKLSNIGEKKTLLSNQTTSEDGIDEAVIKLEDLHCLQEWRLRKYSEDEFVFTFLGDSLVFTVTLGKEINSGDGDCVKQKEISGLHMESVLADDANVCAHLAHNLMQASVDVDLLHAQHPTTVTLKMLLQELSTAVSQADGIADEMDKIKYRHFVTLDGTNPIVQFSNLDAMVKFWVTFHLLPGSYPFSTISADFKHKIGSLRDEDVQSALSQVKPGWTYFRRLVQSIDTLIQQHIPSDPYL